MRKSKNLAALFALFGGSFGLHKFYLNDPGSGMFYFFLSMMTGRFFPIATILGVIDAVRLFSMSTENFNAKYNKHESARRRPVRRGRQPQSRRSRENEMARQRYQFEESSKKKRNNPFRKSASSKFKEYDLEGALEDYERAAEINDHDKDSLFNIACIYSLMEKPDQSFLYLDKAVKAGFKNFEKITSVDELAYLRIQPEFDGFKENGYIYNRQKSVTPPKDDLLQNDVLLSQLNKLKELRSRGLLSEKEFIYEKDKLLRK